MAEQQKLVIRQAQVADAKWRFFTTYRLQLQDCEANERMLDAELADRLLPTTFQNLSEAWEGFPPEKKAMYARPTAENPSVVNSRKPEPESSAQQVVAVADILEKVGEALPAEFTRQRILSKTFSREAYRDLLKRFGKQLIEDRVNGVS